jgi:tRNA (guanine37-N1)-methyltransferase
MNFRLLTIFPELFDSFLATSLIQKAIHRGLLQIERINIRDFAEPPHFKVDDAPFGGGPGMVMKPEPLAAAIQKARSLDPETRIVALSAAGKLFDQSRAIALAKEKSLTFVCGRYEGIDQRIIERYVDEEISIGDYIVMGGEVPAMIVIESVARLIPGVLGNSDSPNSESFMASTSTDYTLLEAPQYTRPEIFGDLRVPAVLLSGDHKAIAAWRKEQSIERTEKNRPDLKKKM